VKVTATVRCRLSAVSQHIQSLQITVPEILMSRSIELTDWTFDIDQIILASWLLRT